MDKKNPFLILLSICILLSLVCSIVVKHNGLAISQKSSTSNGVSLESNKALLLKVSIKYPIITRGSNQTLEFTVVDKHTLQPISGANITGATIYANPHQVPFQVVTDGEGKAAFSWKIPRFTDTGIFIVGTAVSAEGYKSPPEIFDNNGNEANNWSTFRVH